MFFDDHALEKPVSDAVILSPFDQGSSKHRMQSVMPLLGTGGMEASRSPIRLDPPIRFGENLFMPPALE